ncbi:hypothetical protein MLD38_002547 [Melastoma candidum]|uniref:Uncharacterized protein n=1 Tax=Melastoma candidum TaxID=119954 RepID=A0ACB9S880_9MYRT|nr:hypothetical protein MLD38_002547 [Melastoma candidum]
MEALDHEVIAIVKGKRTKRQRLQSSDGDGYFEEEKALVVVNGFSPSTSSAEYYDRDGTTTEEEEDMANCLILLAQGHQPKRSALKSPAATAEDDQEYGKFTSRKYLETDTGSGKVGYYVYECKTCNRTFPSFQALGGHRASHKKPKTNPTPVAIPSSDEEDRPGEFKKYSLLSLQLGSGNGNGNLYGHNNNAANNPGKQGKVHECSICGAEFASGQALGGHMRRHRAPPALPLPQIGIAKLVNSKDEATTTATTTTTTTPTISLDLDLNLPAPEDQNPENVFLLRQQQKKQPSPAATATTGLVFSAAAMVDCHY